MPKSSRTGRRIVDRFTGASAAGGLAAGLSDAGPLVTLGITGVISGVQYLLDDDVREPEALIVDLFVAGAGWYLGRLLVGDPD